jgi:hypothetical protein
MKQVNSMYIAGSPGTGKTYGVARLVNTFGYKAVVIDFENKFKKTIKECFIDSSSNFEHHLGYTKRSRSCVTISKTQNNKLNKSCTENLGFKNSPDWEKSYEYLVDLVNGLIDRTDYDVLIFDGASPVIRNDIGVAKWKKENNRDSPLPTEWAPMNDIENMFVCGGKDWADENDKLFIITGQVKEEYRGDKKIGELPALNPKLQHKLDVTLQMDSVISNSIVSYSCTCLDSIKGQWIEPLTMERHLVDVLIEKELIGYD